MRRFTASSLALLVGLAAVAAVDPGRAAGAEAPAAPPAVEVGPPTVAFVGDSIGRDAEPEIRAAVEATHPIDYFHAIGAGYIGYHLPRLLPVVEAPDGPDIVVVELGTGDAFWSTSVRRFEREVRRFLDTVTPHVDCVVWIDQKPGGNRAYPMINDRAVRFNRVVHRVVPTYEGATFLHYAAWTRLAGAPSPFFLADYLHLTDAGEADLARLVASAVRGCDGTGVSGPFWDVGDGGWGAAGVNWAADLDLVSGYRNDTYRAEIGRFRPVIDRWSAVRMAWRYAGRPEVATPHGWRDTPGRMDDALRWAWSIGVRGTLDGRFRPNAAMNRGDWLHLLWRVAGAPGGYPVDPWTDAARLPVRLAQRWAAAEGIVGSGGGRFWPARPMDRGRATVWLQATDGFLAAPPVPPTPPPAGSTPAPTTTPTTTTPTTVVAPPTTGIAPATVPPGSPATTAVP